MGVPMHTAIRSFLTFVAVLVFWTSPAIAADEVGPVGTLIGLDINTTSAETYLIYHGRIFVSESGGALTEYRFGGTSCGTRILTDAQVAALKELYDAELLIYRQNPAAAKQLASSAELPLPPNADAAELAAWTVVANVLLNLDGVLMKS